MTGGGLFPRREPTGTWWRDHSLSLVVAGIMLAQTVFSVWSARAVWTSEQRDHGGPTGWGAEFWTWWAHEYNTSVVADTYGVLLVVLLTKWLYERGSAESTGD